jgi:hypothetical protein
MEGRGLGYHHFFEVVGSSWAQELKAAHKFHNADSLRDWDQFRHFILRFDRTTFEFLAVTFSVWVREGGLPDVLRETVADLSRRV